MHTELDWLVSLIVQLDDEMRIVDANSALEAALSLSRRQLRGMRFTHFLRDASVLVHAMHKLDALGPASLVRFDAALGREGVGQQAPAVPVQANLTRREADGCWWLEMWPLPQQGKHQGAQLQEQLQAHKDLLRNLAHEVKNPLGGIRGAAQLLGMEIAGMKTDAAPGAAPVVANWSEYTEVILHEVDRLQALVDRLLEPHRHPLRMAPVNIHEVCARVRALVLMEFPQGLTIRQDYDVSLPLLQGDRDQLIQAVLNIVQNAAQILLPRHASSPATPSGEAACIVLRTRVARQVTIGQKLHKLALALQIIDNGPGIDPQLQERIFHPLVTGRDEGSGLGLSLVQAIVQRHQGMVECESEPGRTCFTLTIPLQ